VQRARLLSLKHVRAHTGFGIVRALLAPRQLHAQQALVYGSAAITASAAFSVVVTVKTALAGFALLGYGIAQVCRFQQSPTAHSSSGTATNGLL
jgi:hypothetical protein